MSYLEVLKCLLYKEWMHDYHNSRLHILYITSTHFSDLAASVEVIDFLNASLCVFLYILQIGEKNAHFISKVIKVALGLMLVF